MGHPSRSSRIAYLSRFNAEYIDELFERYLQDPDAVDESWRYFFDGLELGQEEAAEEARASGGEAAPVVSLSSVPGTGVGVDVGAEAYVGELITRYRSRGWLIANINPLSPAPESHPILELKEFGLSEADLDRSFNAGNLLGLGKAKLRDIIARLRQIYCSSIGVQYAHIQNADERVWLQSRIESTGNREALSTETQRYVLRRLTQSEAFERFLHTRYVGQKRFSIEGGEGLIPALDRLIDRGAELGAEQFVMGMAHRGRLNVLANVYNKDLKYIFTEFEQNYHQDTTAGEGDVKYHMGFSADVKTLHGKEVHLSLAHNPSHLEFVNPVVEGIARGKQRQLKDAVREKVVPILIHGDAAIAGQGVVYETLNLSQVEGYWTGGTIHFVINNQVGFTTDPTASRSTTHCTDVATMIEVPIFHVNGDDPEALWYVAGLAMEYRYRFKKDVFIDIICYRKYGHNEGDEPTFTQPLMYQKIKEHPSPREVYAKRLERAGALTAEDAQKAFDQETERMTEAQNRTREEKPQPFYSAYQSVWKKYKRASEEDIFKTVDTSVSSKALHALSRKISELPSDFSVHPKLERVLEARRRSIEEGAGIDWGTAETLAYASLLSEGHTVRISGQDVERGTFSHRHAVLHDHRSGALHVPLNRLAPDQAPFIIHNSTLSETAVLGFEYGWSLSDPDALVIWEAQFGDFANGAQVIIDQFIASGESKWHRASGIVLLLPHGYEGQGPEHSSARLERFLQLCGKHNMSVCNLSTPAQIFHALRRQLKRDFRKPLVVMSPKSLLRHPQALSTLSDLTEGRFEEAIDDGTLADAKTAKKVKRVVLCSGKVYYDLAAEREKKKLDSVAIVRVEQLYPFPAERVSKILQRYPDAELIWTQEEPRNMGSWNYLLSCWLEGRQPFMEQVGNRMIRYIGRDRAAAPAVGSSKIHAKEQQDLVEQALTPE